ncbi:MAG: aminotransferase class I/II-fold pyridoxal phosphate-dependent enzyme [Candidatus Dormibacteria bacterium]
MVSIARAQQSTRGWAQESIAQDRAAGLLRHPRVRTGGNALRGEVDGRAVVEFAANDYLGLSVHPAVQRAAADAVLRDGVGATGSRHLSGGHAAVVELEAELAAFEHTECAAVAPTGYAANVAVLEALGGDDAVIFSDALNHASIIDGCRASRARVVVYRHRDMDDLAARLRRRDRRAVIVSDGVFSTEGSIADVRNLAALAYEHDAWLVIDEAHATGVVGNRGEGTVSAAGISGHPLVVKVVTFSKALGASGAAVCASRDVRQLLLQRGRALIYSTGLAHPIVNAVRASLHVLQTDPEPVQRMRSNAALLHQLLDRVAMPGHDCALPMVAVNLRDAEHATALEQRLLDSGWMVHALRPPTVAPGTSRLRATVSALHEADDIRGMAAALLAAIG